ncbi:Na+/H+ antiporter subunit G [Rhodobacterales bacterium HKCCSP123]|nr:Na+/H+ antiporter subunit G [Rhodobacterales bacterium HKCCSP123]
MSLTAEILISLALVMSGIFGFVGSYGLVKLKDTLQRLHAPTKATTLGVGGVLIASMIYFYTEKGHLSIHELLITLFLFLTAPITANFIAKAYMARNLRREDLPPSGGEYGWSIYDDPPQGKDLAPQPETPETPKAP